MEEYPGNSDKSKIKIKSENQHEKQKPVVKGQVITKKKSMIARFAQSLIGDSISSIGQRMLDEVVIPGVRDTIINAAYTIFGGSPNQSRPYVSSPAGKINYSNITNPTKASMGVTPVVPQKHTYEYDSLIFSTRGDAEAVLNGLAQTIYEYGMAKVSDLFEFAQVSFDHTALKYGWTDISTARVVRVRDGWTINLPKAMPID